jgi:hypothetical protein
MRRTCGANAIFVCFALVTAGGCASFDASTEGRDAASAIPQGTVFIEDFEGASSSACTGWQIGDGNAFAERGAGRNGSNACKVCMWGPRQASLTKTFALSGPADYEAAFWVKKHVSEVQWSAGIIVAWTVESGVEGKAYTKEGVTDNEWSLVQFTAVAAPAMATAMTIRIQADNPPDGCLVFDDVKVVRAR